MSLLDHFMLNFVCLDAFSAKGFSRIGSPSVSEQVKPNGPDWQGIVINKKHKLVLI